MEQFDTIAKGEIREAFLQARNEKGLEPLGQVCAELSGVAGPRPENEQLVLALCAAAAARGDIPVTEELKQWVELGHDVQHGIQGP
jgi:hypothetical protein